MTVKELIKELKQYDGNLQVTIPVNWENADEFGNIESSVIENTLTQVFYDTQFGDNDYTEVMIY
jgi:hypothetical protein